METNLNLAKQQIASLENEISQARHELEQAQDMISASAESQGRTGKCDQTAVQSSAGGSFRHGRKSQSAWHRRCHQ